jgi:hypothetical protein
MTEELFQNAEPHVANALAPLSIPMQEGSTACPTRMLPVLPGMQVGADIVSMLQLEPALRYEFYPFHKPHR